MKYIVIDPSGSFNEGKGHTGITFIEDFDWNTLNTRSIAAKDFDVRHDYWKTIIDTIIDEWMFTDVTVIIESFMIRNNGFLVGKMPETILFIGALVWELEKYKINYIFQTPTQAKSRFKDENLDRYIPNFEKRNGYYYLNNKRTNDHVRDSLKHLLYYQKYTSQK